MTRTRRASLRARTRTEQPGRPDPPARNPYGPPNPYGQPTPNQYGQPSPNPYEQPAPYGAGDPGALRSAVRRRCPEHPQGTTILVLGIVGIFVAICAPIAWYMGSKAQKEIAASGAHYANESQINTGRIMGMVFTIICIVFIVLYIIVRHRHRRRRGVAGRELTPHSATQGRCGRACPAASPRCGGSCTRSPRSGSTCRRRRRGPGALAGRAGDHARPRADVGGRRCCAAPAGRPARRCCCGATWTPCRSPRRPVRRSPRPPGRCTPAVTTCTPPAWSARRACSARTATSCRRRGLHVPARRGGLGRRRRDDRRGRARRGRSPGRPAYGLHVFSSMLRAGSSPAGRAR